MARKCDLCGKTASYGHRVSHSMQHTKRRWLPNIQAATIVIDGKPQRLNVCTRCLRSQNKLAR